MAFSVLEHAEGQYGIIGPRPERPEFAEQLAAEVPYYRLRHTVKPELTGWVQVMRR
ncbi:MAG: sugar transferase [Anaerolineae bacterium]|nr:sugar transferase [Anaerolineae bacterium]